MSEWVNVISVVLYGCLCGFIIYVHMYVQTCNSPYTELNHFLFKRINLLRYNGFSYNFKPLYAMSKPTRLKRTASDWLDSCCTIPLKWSFYMKIIYLNYKYIDLNRFYFHFWSEHASFLHFTRLLFELTVHCTIRQDNNTTYVRTVRTDRKWAYNSFDDFIRTCF